MREMRIFNGTPHPISVIDDSCITFKNEIRKYVCTGKPVIVAQIPSNGVLSAKIDTVETGKIGDIPVFVKKITGCDPIPEGYDIIVVSALYATAAKMAGLDTHCTPSVIRCTGGRQERYWAAGA